MSPPAPPELKRYPAGNSLVHKRMTIIGIVLDPEFGERLLTVANEMPVWIVDTPINRSWAERVWSSANVADRGAVTTFSVNPNQPAEYWCRDILPMIDLHHGKHSQRPAYSAVDVLGTQLTPRLRKIFAEYGFKTLTERPDGFRASRLRVAG
jgi:hypothetical protein